MIVADRFNFLTAPLCKVWEGLLRRGIEAKAEYTVRCEQVEQFYSGASNFMWNPAYINRFMGGSSSIIPPKFQIVIAKAFEYVAVMKPMLFWQMAARKVRPYKPLDIDPLELLGIKPPQEGQQPTPEEEQMLDFALNVADEQAMMDVMNDARAKVLEHVLNYYQREQPAGLAAHINTCLDDALLYGAAFMRTTPYRFPASERTLVKSIRIPAKDVFVDPDSMDPLWLDAKWIAIRHEWSYAETEKYFDLPPGSLRSYGTKMTTAASWQRGSDLPPSQTRDSKKDLIEWYEIFSRAGCGNQLIGTRAEIEPEFDDALIENCAYLCIAKGCPYPLNLPSGKLAAGIFTEEQAAGTERPGATKEWVTEQLRWPTEYWRDDKWPIAKLAFYPHSSNSLWPEPPLAPAIGELTALNILISAYVQTAYDNRQQICAVMKGAVDNLQNIQTSNVSPFFFEINPQFNSAITDSVNKIIQFMNRPEINQDVPKTIEFLMQLIEQRTGMSPRLYGENSGAVSRSATDATALNNSVNLRPEYMRKCVAEWQSAVADMEVFASWSHVLASDLKEELGPTGTIAYEMLVTNAEPEAILRGCYAYVEASEIARPNKERDAQMLDRMQQVFVPIFQGYLAQHNDPAPLNGFLKSIAEATDIDVTPFLIPPPAPDSQAIQMQQAMQQAELEKTQADAAKTMAEAQNIGVQGQNAQADAELKGMQAEHQMSLKEREAALKEQQAALDMEIKQQESADKLAAQDLQAQGKAAATAQQMHLKQKQFEFDTAAKAVQGQQTMEQRRAEARQKLLQNMLTQRQKLMQQDDVHQQQLTHAEEKAAQDAQHSNMIIANRMMMQGLRGNNGSA